MARNNTKKFTPEEFAEEVKKYHLAIGDTLLAWANVELSMAMIFREIVKDDPAISDIIWASINNFKSQERLLSNLVEASIKDENHLNAWRDFRRIISDKYVWRNEVAHATLYPDPDYRPRLVPSFSLERYTTQEALTLDDLRKYREVFDLINSALLTERTYYNQLNNPLPPLLNEDFFIGAIELRIAQIKSLIKTGIAIPSITRTPTPPKPKKPRIPSR